MDALLKRAGDSGWRCGGAGSLPRFSGPGRKVDTCPMATTYAREALALVEASDDSAAVQAGVAAILDHWEHQQDCKLRMFGIGTESRKLRYPFVWYDILHVADVLSRFARAREMVTEIAAQADGAGRHTATSMYRSWKGWSFADKGRQSPWLTLLALRIRCRLGESFAVA